jgi:uroporphyrinogen decarboxylase
VPHPGAHLPLTPANLAEMARRAKALRASTDRAIVGLFGGNLFEMGQFLFGMEGFFVLLGSDRAYVEKVLDRLVEIHTKNLDFWLKAVGPYVDVVLFGDDYGMQTGPQISPRMFRELFKPRHKVLWQRPKLTYPVKVMLHSCGAISELLNDMIEIGLDTTNPVQTNCRNMEPERLKKEFGGRLALWGGGCETQQVLRAGTPAEVRENVLSNMDILAPGGGFIFQQVHNIMADVSPESIVAMFDAVAEFNGIK